MFTLVFINRKGERQTVELATERIVQEYLKDNNNVVKVIIITNA